MSNPRDVDRDRSVDYVFCDALADERETINLWNNPRFPYGEAHTECYAEWKDKPTYVVLNLDWLAAHNPDSPDAGDELLVGIKNVYLTREKAEGFINRSPSKNYTIAEVTDDVWPEH